MPDNLAPLLSEPRFVVQRHRATRLHYDFRLEIDGVLVSWAVPKGPTLDPAVRRAAFHVDDHPLSYFDFEGVIPSGYGSGDVIVWDVGTWQQHPHKASTPIDPGRAVAAGELHFDVLGEKLQGRFVLVRSSRSGRSNEWLMLHKRDEFAVQGWDPEDHPFSVLSGRTNDQVKADPDREWRTGSGATELKASETDLAQLDSIGNTGTWHVFGRDLKLTTLATKRDLLRYTAQIAPATVPYLAGRTLKLPRAAPKTAPDWLTRRGSQLTVSEPAALLWATNFGAVPWISPASPTIAVIDLEATDKGTWADVLVLARLYRTAFDHLGLTARAKTSGLKSINIWVPIESGQDYATTRAWVEQLSTSVSAVVPELAALVTSSAAANASSKTLLLPYSPLPEPGTPVSAPLAWYELDDPALDPAQFTIHTMPQRLNAHGDLFREVLTATQKLPRLP